MPSALAVLTYAVDPLHAAPHHSVAAAFDVVGIAASAGGLRALTTVLSALPADFPAPIAVVQHLDPRRPSLMAGILGRSARLTVKEAQDGERLQPGVVYVAPPDRHLLINANGTFTLTRSELVHFVRPSADLLFESLAASFHSRAIGIVLTGSGSDGALGLRAIKRLGGYVIAQDEATAEFFGMPDAAIRTGVVDDVLRIEHIAPALLSRVARAV